MHLSAFETSNIADLLSWFPSQREFRQWTGEYLSYPPRPSEMVDHLERSRMPRSQLRLFRIQQQASEVMLGYGELTHIWPGLSARLSRLVVAPEHRHKGVGTQLTRCLVEHAFQEFAVARVDLGVEASNSVAIKLYEKLEFERVGTWEDVFGTSENPFNMHWYSLSRERWSGTWSGT